MALVATLNNAAAKTQQKIQSSVSALLVSITVTKSTTLAAALTAALPLTYSLSYQIGSQTKDVKTKIPLIMELMYHSRRGLYIIKDNGATITISGLLKIGFNTSMYLADGNTIYFECNEVPAAITELKLESVEYPQYDARTYSVERRALDVASSNETTLSPEVQDILIDASQLDTVELFYPNGNSVKWTKAELNAVATDAMQIVGIHAGVPVTPSDLAYCFIPCSGANSVKINVNNDTAAYVVKYQNQLA